MTLLKAYQKGRKRYNGRLIPRISSESCSDPLLVKVGEITVHGSKVALEQLIVKKGFSQRVAHIADYRETHNSRPGMYIGIGTAYRTKTFSELVAITLGLNGDPDYRPAFMK